MVNRTEHTKIFSNNLRRIMHERGKTQADMARDLNVGKSRVSSWMNGQHIPRPEMLDMICDYLKCSRTDLLEPNSGRKTRTVSREQAELIQLTMNAEQKNVQFALELLKRLEHI